MHMMIQMERTITVKGPTIETMSMPGIPGMPGMIAPIGDAYAALAASTMRPMGPMLNNQQMKTTKMWVPNSMVGAIIGAKKKRKNRKLLCLSRKKRGREMGRKKGRKSLGSSIGHSSGSFNDVAEQSQHYIDEVKLRTELIVPSRLVGRIIGKGGQNVRELQRITGASVKIPEDEPKVVEPRSPQEEGKEDSSSPSPSDGTIVRIVGNFSATQSVQCRIGQLINDYTRAFLQEKKKEDGQGKKTAHKQSPPSHANGAD
uniref:KH domain-containing protein n=1 Tax=Heterorhabditis bacteriophora TaxID=37862 RepID=A0A1I7WRA0_HETBA